MKEENKTLRNQIAVLRDEKPLSLEKTLEETMTVVQNLQRKYDLLKNESQKKREYLDQLEIKKSELSIGATMHSSEASPEMRHIRVLENRLDKTMIKYNEAQSIRKTYEAIVKRLKQERMGFDNQLAGIERTLKAKERDYEELLLLSHDAYHAKEMAQAELHRFEQGVMEERNQRDKEVQEKKALVEQRVEMNKRLEMRERIQKQQQQEIENAQRAQARDLPAAEASGGAADVAEDDQKIQLFIHAFNQIKEATGVNDPNEIIQKFLTQDDTQKNLTQLTKDNHALIEKLQEERRRLRSQVEELKFSNGGGGGRRQAIDDFESHLGEATEKCERNRGKYERLARMLIDVKAGISHLAELLIPIKLEGEAPQPLEMTDETVEEVLQESEKKISKLLSLTAKFEEISEQQRQMDEERYEEKLMMRSQSEARIKLTDKEEDNEDDDDFDEEIDEDVFSRKQAIQNSEQILEKNQTKNRLKGKGKKKD
mmetsp:Transcript_838/g.1881  ORF Transcript_838/g.1881 Transcript_838/m.1881 type:complete len:484 (-) Transcript_838:134-1585(-)